MKLRRATFLVLLGIFISAWLAAVAFVVLMPEQPSKAEQGWTTYTDERFAYRIDHPAGLSAIPSALGSRQEGDAIADGGVSFAVPGLPGTMGVKVYRKPPVSTLQEWLDTENGRRASANVRVEIEQSIDIDGHEAWVTHVTHATPGFEEPFPQEKTTVFFRGSNLFEIWTKFYDDEGNHGKVWKSIRFQP